MPYKLKRRKNKYSRVFMAKKRRRIKDEVDAFGNPVLVRVVWPEYGDENGIPMSLYSDGTTKPNEYASRIWKRAHDTSWVDRIIKAKLTNLGG